MKLFKTSNCEIVCECRNYFCFCLPSELLAKRYNDSWLNSIVSNRRIIVIVNDSYYVALGCSTSVYSDILLVKIVFLLYIIICPIAIP